MILASWSVRGLNAPQKRRDISDFIKKHKILVIGLLEIKIKEKKLLRTVLGIPPHMPQTILVSQQEESLSSGTILSVI